MSGRRVRAGGRPALARTALAWSALNGVALRVGTLILGIVLARLLTPEAFGVYAVALSVQAVLMTLADFGLSTDLVRAADPARRAPTVATLGLVTGTGLAVAMAASAAPVATALGAPDAQGVLVVLALTLVLGGAGVVPFAALQRRLDQRSLFGIALVDLVVSTVVTLLLLAAGWGVVALAIGRVAAQSIVLALQFAVSGERVRFGWDRAVAPSALRFGLPVALANLLSWAVLGADKIVLAALLDPAAVGYYVLAFNVSTWPMTAVGQVVRSVALPVFARAAEEGRPLRIAPAVAVTWALALPLGGALAVLAGPVIAIVYGERWLPAAPALAALGLLGALRVLADLLSSAVLAVGGSGRVALVQLLWFAALMLVLIPATTAAGFVGAGWAHVAVALAVVAPAFALVLHSLRVPLLPVLGALWPPLAAGIPSAAVVVVVRAALPTGGPWLVLAVGGALGALCYLALLRGWVVRRLAELRAGAGPAESASPSGLAAPSATDASATDLPSTPPPAAAVVGALTAPDRRTTP